MPARAAFALLAALLCGCQSKSLGFEPDAASLLQRAADRTTNAEVEAAPKKAGQAKHAAVEAAPKKATEDSPTKDDTISVKLID
eukprot:CAMPEP_0171190102 /NCGR_PEP_ID=MMETSP0790-20130122/18685_1 /TAXON_ID=2925 /ORGANISM="Alexandrium catenella, Strain OF101" /LENGTH=83 /DNA_ID=CAMNT_0011655227 /DNA_START=110 /DNA_END=358 /DNA_ORIENTATION=+